MKKKTHGFAMLMGGGLIPSSPLAKDLWFSSLQCLHTLKWGITHPLTLLGTTCFIVSLTMCVVLLGFYYTNRISKSCWKYVWISDVRSLR
jgi:hypothetical protein